MDLRRKGGFLQGNRLVSCAPPFLHLTNTPNNQASSSLGLKWIPQRRQSSLRRHTSQRTLLRQRLRQHLRQQAELVVAPAPQVGPAR